MTMKILQIFITLLVYASVVTTSVAAQQNNKLPQVVYDEYKLSNGLRVIMHQDKSTPIVSVNVWYHVGSKNDTVGKTGFAHLFEHMMFQGSKNYNADYSKPFEEAGGIIQGSTNLDRTRYYEVLPSNFLELALFMEADRMGGLLDALTLDRLNIQRDVVKNERRQNYDNVPYGTAGEKIARLLYPKEHPYSWLPIGSLDDLTAASIDDVKAYFRKYYVPNNASLVIAGDFNPKQARSWVEKYFGSIPKGASIKRPSPVSPTLNGEIRKTFEDNVQLPRLYMVWHSVPQYSGDDAALEMLASILSQGRGSRLQSNLVQNRQLAQSVSASNISAEIAGTFRVISTAGSGKSLEEIEREINTEIERLKQEPPTAEEMARSLNNIKSSFIYNLQKLQDMADKINSYTTFLGKPDYFKADLERYSKVTPADIQRVAKTYLTHNCLVMSVLKGTNKDLTKPSADADKPTSRGEKKKEYISIQESNLPQPGPDPKLSLPPIEKMKLSNGLEVWVVRHNKLPIASMNLILKSGTISEPADKTGVANILSNLLDDGTKTRSALDIANQLQSIGASLVTNSEHDSTKITVQTLTENFDQALDIFSDVIVNPTFPEEELSKYRQRLLSTFIQNQSVPNAVAFNVFTRMIYSKNHPYGRQISGEESVVKTITRADIQNFYHSYYRPNNATLIITGNVDSKTLMPKLEKSFAGWKPNEVKTMEIPNAPQPEKTHIYIVDKPEAPQSTIYIGQVGAARNNPDYFPILVMNTISSSRINTNLRQNKGYAYNPAAYYQFNRGAGYLVALADVQTAVTKESVVEFIKEFHGIRGEIAVTRNELELNKQRLIRRFPAFFETIGQISNQLSNQVVHGLPDTYFNNYIDRINAVTIEDVNRAANKYAHPDKMVIVVVGDRKRIEPKLMELGIPVMGLDSQGNPAQ